MSNEHETSNTLTPDQEARRQEQMADAAEWYGWEHYGPKEGWKVENIRVTSMPDYRQDEDGNWHIDDGGIGVNVIGDMLERPQYIEREDGYALRIDVESIDWWFRFTNVESGEVQDIGWSHHELKSGLTYTVYRSPIWFLGDGKVWEFRCWARPRLRRAKYDPGVARTEALWSSEAAGIGESEPGDMVSESAVYLLQWHEDQYEMLSWPVGGEKPVSHLPWYQPPVDQERLDWYNALRQRQGAVDLVDDVPAEETRSVVELRAAVEAMDAETERRNREAGERQEANRQRRDEEDARWEAQRQREEAEQAERKAEYEAEQERLALENNKQLFYQYFQQQGADTLEAKAELLRSIYHDPQWDAYDKAAEAVAVELGVVLNK